MSLCFAVLFARDAVEWTTVVMAANGQAGHHVLQQMFMSFLLFLIFAT